MEQILKILKQLMATGGMLGGIPKPIKMGVLYFSVFVGVLVIFKYAKLDQTTKTFLTVLIVLLAVITGIYYAWKGFNQKQQNKQFGGDISQHSSATPRGVSDPGQRARLDDMRKKFQSGIEAYKSRGKDLYKLPWYVIVGEPGSGKTEAIRHSNVGFPPGMQDEFQGVGGTINMNWWFTNHAVLLDTAGRLMFEEVKPGETSEWKEFLALLKKNRPTCPINGLFLVIPSDSLIKDSADSIQKKAGKIAQQLDVIQRVLDVRFPVFIAVTKCDKINGFREFFDTLTDPQLQHQMMGWSNPDPLDEPFKPEMVDKHLEQVAARLRRRRLGLLRDPVPENPEGRRTDEVDSLYALPHSLELLSSRLRRYLETIFVAGEWSAKPLFLRGIYFSSSMREGAALDAELAEAIGVSVDELPEGKVWERERAYFLRDVFLEKAFREKGLVTRATNTKRMLMGQQIALYSCGFVGLALFCVVAWFAMGSLRNGVKDQGDYWHLVSVEGWDNKYWKASIVPIRGDGAFMSTISTNTKTVDGKQVTLGEFHAKLRELAEKPMKKSMFFPLLADRYNKNRHNAQRIVFEAGVIRPLMEASRQKMTHDDGDPASAQREPDALAALIQIESDILTRGTGTNKGTLNEDSARRILSAFQNYVAAADVPVDTNLVSVMAWTYSTNEAAKGSWAPRWFSGGKGGTNTLAVNSSINAGLDVFARSATNGIQSYVTDWDRISSVRTAARTFADYEQTLFTAAAGGLDANFTKAEHEVEKARKNLDEESAKASKSSYFAGGVSLTNALQKFQSAVNSSAGAAFGRVREVNDAALAANRDYPLFKQIKERLEGIQLTLKDRIKTLLDSGDPKEFQTLDDTCLTAKSFAARADLYARAEKYMTDNSYGSTKLVGLKGEPLEKVLKDGLGEIKNQAAAYSGKLNEEFKRTITYQLKRVEKAQYDAFFGTYLAEVKKMLSSDSGFPLTRDISRPITVANFTAAGKQLKYVSDDFDSAIFKTSALEERADWKGFLPNIKGQKDVANALLGAEGILGSCTISLAKMSDATRSKDEWRGSWRDIKLVAEGSAGGSVRTDNESDLAIGDAPVQQKLELRVYKNIGAENAQPFTIATGEWGPLWLIHKYKGERDKAEGKSWLVEIPMEAPGASGKVRLILKFERALPELDKWGT
jgi:IcmF-related N-terminal domain